MKQFFFNWADPIALLISFIIPLIIAIKVVKKSKKQARSVAAFFLLFGPSAIVAHMSFHLLEIGITAIINSLDGVFIYNFRFYSLMLMGVVITYLSFVLLQQGIAKCKTSRFRNRHLYKTMGFIVLLSAPTIFFTPIGSLPTMACIINLIALPFVHKKNRQVVVTEMKEEAIAISA
jgi:hypothetical protein